MKTGLLHPMQITRDFEEWRMYIKEGFIRVVFRKKNGRRCLFTSPFCPYIKENTGDTFSPKMNGTEWQILDEEFKILFERQKTKYPQQHKKQKSDTIKDINYKRKHSSYKFSITQTETWTNYLLSICRKRI